MARSRRDLAIPPKDCCQLRDSAPSHLHNHAQGLGKDPDLGTGILDGIRFLVPRIGSESLLLLGLLDFSGCGSIDLGEIRQFRPWKCFAFKFSQLHSCTLVRDGRPKIAMYSRGDQFGVPWFPRARANVSRQKSCRFA